MVFRNRKHAVCWVLGSLLITSAAMGSDWRQWGGSTRDFKVNADSLASSWPEQGPHKIWSRPLGQGYSSMAVLGRKLIAMYRKEDLEVVTAINTLTGKTIWESTYSAPPLEGQRLDFGKGPNSSPLVLDTRVITIGFTSKMNCFSLKSGELIWSHDLIAEYGGETFDFGYAPSPILYKGVIIVLVGGDRQGVMAFNPDDGSVSWKSDPYDVSYASPIIIDVDGQDQLVLMTSTEVVGLAADGGAFLWKHPCENQYKINATDPIWGDDHLLWVATQTDGGTRVLHLTQKDGKTSVEEVWKSDDVQVFHWNAVRVGDYVYASIGGTSTRVAAVNVKNGEIAWRQAGFNEALCIYADDKLIFLDEDGKLVLARVSPKEMKILAQTQLTEKVSWTVPVLVGSTPYVRDTKNIMALDLGRNVSG